MKALRMWMVCMLLVTLVLASCAAPNANTREPGGDKSAPPETSGATQNAETSGTQAAVIEPEQLVSQTEAEQLLGVPVTAEMSEQAVVGLKLCFYDAGDAGYLQIGITQQAFMPEGSPSTPQSIYDGIHGAFPDAESAGVGEDSFVATNGYNVMQDGYYISVIAFIGNEADNNAVMKQAAEIALTHLAELTDN